MQAAAPAVEITRLLSLLGVGTQVLRGMGAVLLLVAGLSVFIALWSRGARTPADLALLRMLGAPPRRVAGAAAARSPVAGLLASALGLLLSQALAYRADVASLLSSSTPSTR
jgi:putative ABC transport system permease protein